MEFARKVKDEEKGGRATLILATPEDESLRDKFYDQVDYDTLENFYGLSCFMGCHVILI